MPSESPRRVATKSSSAPTAKTPVVIHAYFSYPGG
jgi:hypothetical protein